MIPDYSLIHHNKVIDGTAIIGHKPKVYNSKLFYSYKYIQ